MHTANEKPPGFAARQRTNASQFPPIGTSTKGETMLLQLSNTLITRNPPASRIGRTTFAWPVPPHMITRRVGSEPTSSIKLILHWLLAAQWPTISSSSKDFMYE